MATFFVGQLVRVKWADEPAAKCLIGSETRIIRERGPYSVGSWVLDLPHPRGGNWMCAKADAGECLEPITPSGHQPCDTEFKRDLDRLLEGVAA